MVYARPAAAGFDRSALHVRLSRWLRGCRDRHHFARLLPEVNTHNMQVFVGEFAKTIKPDEHVALCIDGAGWHNACDLKFPDNITPMRLPPYAPEVNPIERVWEHLKERCLSQRLLNDYDAIVTATCIAWNKLRDDPGRIASLTWIPWRTMRQKWWTLVLYPRAKHGHALKSWWPESWWPESWWIDRFDHAFDCLTQSEARTRKPPTVLTESEIELLRRCKQDIADQLRMLRHRAAEAQTDVPVRVDAK